jgi:LuxR family maltose regulon positive regulatory protein
VAGPRLARKVAKPTPRAGDVVKPGLLAALDRGVDGGLLLVVAPAGFGKTTSLGAWAARTSWPVAWLSLSETEREPDAFLEALVASIRTVAPDFGDSVLAMRRMAELPAPPVIAAALAAELADLSEAMTLGLDDGHRIADGPAQEIVAELVSMLADDTRLILATRRRLSFRGAMLRGRGRLVEIGPTELRFNATEIGVRVAMEQKTGISRGGRPGRGARSESRQCRPGVG